MQTSSGLQDCSIWLMNSGHSGLLEGPVGTRWVESKKTVNLLACVMVEAKSYVEEFYANDTRAVFRRAPLMATTSRVSQTIRSFASKTE